MTAWWLQGAGIRQSFECFHRALAPGGSQRNSIRLSVDEIESVVLSRNLIFSH